MDSSLIPSSRPLVTVTGGTGAQGGSVARHLIRDGAFRVRCVVRGLTAPKALELASLGCELVYGNYDDAESMVRAFDGAWGVFAVTNYWELLNEAHETAQGKTLVDAARTAGVRHFIWSTMEYTRDPCAPHWNSKAAVNDYLVQSGVPYTSLYTVFYFENFLTLPFFQLRWASEPESVSESLYQCQHSEPKPELSEPKLEVEHSSSCRGTFHSNRTFPDLESEHPDSDVTESGSCTSAASDDTLNGHEPSHTLTGSDSDSVAVSPSEAGELSVLVKPIDASLTPRTAMLDFDLKHDLRTGQGGEVYCEPDHEHGVKKAKAKTKRRLIADWPLLQSDGPIGGFSVAEIGIYAVEAFKNPYKWLNTSIRPISSVFTPRDVVAAVSASLSALGSLRASTTSASLDLDADNEIEIEIELCEVTRAGFEAAGACAKAEWDAVHRRHEEERRDPMEDEDVNAKSVKGTGVWELWTNMGEFVPFHPINAPHPIPSPTIFRTFLAPNQPTMNHLTNCLAFAFAFTESFYKHAGNPGRDFALTEALNPARKTLAEFVAAHIDQFIPPVPPSPSR